MPKKPLSVAVPASLSLKAELERARRESSGSAKKHSTVRPGSELGSANQGVYERARRDELALQSEREPGRDRVHEALEEKARIYDALSGVAGTTGLDEDRLTKILDESSVDFVRRRRELRDEHERGSRRSVRDLASSSDVVEIIDEFGRTRLVPRSEARLYQQPSRSGSSYGSSASSSGHSSDSDGGAAARTEPMQRNYGTNYYRLSADSAEREAQLAMLRSLHEKTAENRHAASMSIADMQRQQHDQRRNQIRAAAATQTP
ncbi:TOR complex subunit lst8 [Coemansia sp. RSA 552]|nr:TOR complex subunit lst8 [Coemansia sp. RSA 552]